MGVGLGRAVGVAVGGAVGTEVGADVGADDGGALGNPVGYLSARADGFRVPSPTQNIQVAAPRLVREIIRAVKHTPWASRWARTSARSRGADLAALTAPTSELA